MCDRIGLHRTVTEHLDIEIAHHASRIGEVDLYGA